MIQKLFNAIVPPVSPDAFTAEAARCVKSMDDTAKVEIVQPFEMKVRLGSREEPLQMHLANAYVNYLNQRFRRRAVIQNYVRALIETDVEVIIPKNVIPTIKDKGYVEEVRQQVKERGGKPEEFFVTEAYNEELIIVYAVDSPRSIRFLTPGDLPELNMQGESLRAFTVNNLKQILPAVEVHGEPPFFSLKAGEMFESSLLLLDRVWDKTQLRIAGDIIVAVPSRETLLVADSSSEMAMKKIRRKARDVASTAAYRLTDKLFIRHGQQFDILV